MAEGCDTRKLNGKPLAIRWTVGDVSDAGFEALRLSIHGAHRLFGPEAWYDVCVNSNSVEMRSSEQGSCRTGCAGAGPARKHRRRSDHSSTRA